MADNDETDLGRRDLIKLGAAATLAASFGVGEPLAAQAPAAAAPSAAARTFLTPEELALVDELSEMIIPTDEQSPGARAARVAAYIDSRLADAWEEQERIDWREGLKRINELSQETGGTLFMQSSADQRLTVLTRIAQNEKDPRQAEERFFVKLKSRVVDAYYTSEIGIKQDMDYKGNSYLTEFVGTDVS
jgi:Gluconate 2-dehydrogenase subunit 3